MRTLFTLILLLSFETAMCQGYSGLIARWNFNGNANDISGHGLNGTVLNVTSDTGYNGLPNQAYRFNGVNSKIVVPFDTTMNTNNYSFCTLINPSGFYSGNCQGNYIVHRISNNQNIGMCYFDGAYDNDCSTFSPNNEVFCPLSTQPYPHWYDSTHLVHPNTWYCVVTTYANDTLKLYIDGGLTQAYYQPNYASTGNNDLSIGMHANSTLYPVNGKIDELRFYNRALSLQEVNTFCDSVKMRTTSIGEIKKEVEILSYPNPVHDKLTIMLSELGNVYIANSVGQIIISGIQNSLKQTLDLSQLPNGLYFLKIEVNNQLVIRKIIKD